MPEIKYMVVNLKRDPYNKKKGKNLFVSLPRNQFKGIQNITKQTQKNTMSHLSWVHLLSHSYPTLIPPSSFTLLSTHDP